MNPCSLPSTPTTVFNNLRRPSITQHTFLSSSFISFRPLQPLNSNNVTHQNGNGGGYALKYHVAERFGQAMSFLNDALLFSVNNSYRTLNDRQRPESIPRHALLQMNIQSIHDVQVPYISTRSRPICDHHL